MKRKATYSYIQSQPKRTKRHTGGAQSYVPPSQTLLGRASAVEKKVSDTDTTVQDINTTGDFQLLCAPTPGSDMTNRIGRKIRIKSVYIRGDLRQQAASALSVNVGSYPLLARMIIFVDNQPNGAAPALTDILKEALSSSQLNLNNRDRFKVLCDKQWALDPYLNVDTATQSRGAVGRCIQAIKVYKKLDIETIFNAGTAGTVADINTGALYMLWVGNNAASGNDGIATVSTRVRFSDM